MQIKLNCCRAARYEETKGSSIMFLDRFTQKVEDAPSCTEKQIEDSRAQMKAGSVGAMGKRDEFETNEFVINDNKTCTKQAEYKIYWYVNLKDLSASNVPSHFLESVCTLNFVCATYHKDLHFCAVSSRRIIKATCLKLTTIPTLLE